MYATFLERLGQAYKPEKIQGMRVLFPWKLSAKFTFDADGKFGAMMNVSLTNEVGKALPTFVTLLNILSFRDLWRSRLILGNSSMWMRLQQSQSRQQRELIPLGVEKSLLNRIAVHSGFLGVFATFLPSVMARNGVWFCWYKSVD